MQTKKKCFIVIDLSKAWFDVSLISVLSTAKKPMVTERFDNTEDGLKLLSKWLKAHEAPLNENTLVVIENTGVYHRLIWKYCSEKNLSLHIGNAANIKWSLGITRGKDDVADSKRLCAYCYRHADELKAAPAVNPAI